MAFLTNLTHINRARDHVSTHNSMLLPCPLGRKDLFGLEKNLFAGSTTYPRQQYFSVVSISRNGPAFSKRATSDYSVGGQGETLRWSLRFSSFPLFFPHSRLHRLSYSSLCDSRTPYVPLGLTYIISIFVNLLPYTLSQFNAVQHLIESLVHVSLPLTGM